MCSDYSMVLISLPVKKHRLMSEGKQCIKITSELSISFIFIPIRNKLFPFFFLFVPCLKLLVEFGHYMGPTKAFSELIQCKGNLL